MAKIEFNWECQACLAKNPQTVTKPGYFQSSVFSAKCKSCLSEFTIKVVKFKGNRTEGQIQYGVIDANLTEEGRQIFDRRAADLEAMEQKKKSDSNTNPTNEVGT